MCGRSGLYFQGPMALSKSAVELFHRCNRAYRYVYVDGYEGVGQGREQAFGIAGHTVLESMLKGETPDWSRVDLEGTDKDKLAKLLGRCPSPLPQMLHVEHPFNLGDVKGIMDAVELHEGKYTVWEHKFTKTDFNSEWGQTYWDKLRVDWQVGLYQLAARRLFNTSDVEVMYNVYRIPQQKQKRGEGTSEYLQRIGEEIDADPSKYYARARIKWSDASLAELSEDLKQTTARVYGSKSSDKFPRSRRCFEWGRRCEFYATCFEGEPLTNEKLYQVRKPR